MNARVFIMEARNVHVFLDFLLKVMAWMNVAEGGVYIPEDAAAPAYNLSLGRTTQKPTAPVQVNPYGCCNFQTKHKEMINRSYQLTTYCYSWVHILMQICGGQCWCKPNWFSQQRAEVPFSLLLSSFPCLYFSLKLSLYRCRDLSSLQVFIPLVHDYFQEALYWF